MMTKYAHFGDAKVVEIKGAADRQRHASLDKLADYDDYRTDDGYMYARIIAISSRVNKNNDGWPSVELVGGEEPWKAITGSNERTSNVGPITAAADSKYKYGYSTFVGKPIFVDHNNSDTKRARGVIVDSKIHIDDAKVAAKHDGYYSSTDVDPEHLPPTKVELLLEIDAKAFPKFAKAIRSGDLDGFSMGCDVEKSKCSHCGNEATSPSEYCSHIVSKGALHDFETTSSDGRKRRTSRKSYENCYGIKFFEISGVFDPADETALAQEIIDESNHREAAQMRCPYCSGTGCEKCGMQGTVEAGQGSDGSYILNEQPLLGETLDTSEFGHVGDPTHIGPTVMTPNLGPGSTMSPPLDIDPRTLRRHLRDLPMNQRYQGSYLQMRTAARKEADLIQNHIQPSIEEIMAYAEELARGGLDMPTAMKSAEQQLLRRNMQAMGQPGADDIGPDHVKVKDTTPWPQGVPGPPNLPGYGDPNPAAHGVNPEFYEEAQALLPKQPRRNDPRWSGVQKEADNPLPQFMHTKAPADVDTLREEQVCPVCGEIMDGEKCDVCGHVKEPEGFDNPDLSQARGGPDLGPQQPGVSTDEAPNSEQNTVLDGAPAPGATDAVSYLQSRKNGSPPALSSTRTAGQVNITETPLKPGTKPATNEPKEIVISDQLKPVTSTYRTAMDLIQAATQSKQSGDTMEDHTKVAAEPADQSGKPDKRVDVNGIGGVMDATNEKASEPTGSHSWENAGTQTDVTGKGGVIEDSNAEASKPSVGTEDVLKKGENQVGDPTRTWDNSNEPNSAVTDKAVQAAKQGVKPIGPSDVQPERRENLEQESGFSNPQKGTDQWTGTGGNGVTRQQDPVTRKVDPNISVSKTFSHVVAAMKIADTEVELGLTEKDKKYDRVAELEALSPEELAAEERVIARVKTAGLAKTASTRRQAATREGELSGRVPSFRTAGQIEPKQAQQVTDELTDSSLFLR